MLAVQNVRGEQMFHFNRNQETVHSMLVCVYTTKCEGTALSQCQEDILL